LLLNLVTYHGHSLFCDDTIARSIAKVPCIHDMADKFHWSGLGLNPTEDVDEVNTHGDTSHRMMAAAEGFLVYNPHNIIISRHTAQIALLKTEIEGKDEEIERLKKETRDLRKENEGLKVALHSKDKKIKALENKIDKLESDKAALQKKLSSLEVELESVRREVIELQKANKANEAKNATLEEELQMMSTKVNEMSKILDENALENASRKKEIKNVQETVQLTALSGGFDKKALTQSSEQQSKIEKATINLGQLCWRVQAMMYQSVFPHRYDDKTSYKVKHIEEDIDGISDDQLKDGVKQRWDEFKKKLNWKKARHQRAMKSLQDSGNQTAHPTLTEKVLVDSADLMNKEGKLFGWHSYECVKELIEMWKTLKQQ